MDSYKQEVHFHFSVKGLYAGIKFKTVSRLFIVAV